MSVFSLREADIKRAVEDYLQYGQNQGKWVFLRLNSGEFIEVRGKTRRRIKGCPKGTADFLVITKGEICLLPKCCCIFIEVKSSTGRQSPEQKNFEYLVEVQGAEYYIVRSVEELQKIL
jgi:hypothetical protein